MSLTRDQASALLKLMHEDMKALVEVLEVPCTTGQTLVDHATVLQVIIRNQVRAYELLHTL